MPEEGFIHVLMNPQWKSWFRIMPACSVDAATAPDRPEPSLLEVLLVLIMESAIYLGTIYKVGGWGTLVTPHFDAQFYVDVASTIRQWHFPGGESAQFFWGYPYVIAGLSKLFSIPGLTAAVIISFLASVAVCVLVHRLYGGWVAATFVVMNFEWIQRALGAGSEPLFMCLLYASFLLARSDRWNLAALLAALSTTVRPVGVFALVSFAAVLAWRRSYRQLATITLLGLTVGVLYCIPVRMVMGTPLASFIAYKDDWGSNGWPITYPFGAMVSGFLTGLHGDTRWWRLVWFVAWLIIALAGAVAVWLPRSWHRVLANYHAEALFTSLYLLFFLSYNYGGIVRFFPRFVIPVLPILLFSMRDKIPRDRRVLWVAAALSALLGAADVVSFRSLFGFGLR
ncbi:MAG TPA: hypothetical protein VKO18_00640 [Terriglobia bacterium]|nr:hypothetical protein [Terriglobia bacterium]